MIYYWELNGGIISLLLYNYPTIIIVIELGNNRKIKYLLYRVVNKLSSRSGNKFKPKSISKFKRKASWLWD